MLGAGLTLEGRYRIERLLGEGGMGAVYLGRHLQLDVAVAIKEMTVRIADEAGRRAAVEQFRLEARLLADLRHPNLPRVHDFFEADGHHYLVMDFVQGRTLSDVQEAEGRIDEARVRAWGAQLADVLGSLHRQSIIFRDLKPSNIMLDAKGDIQLIDFGIAKIFDGEQGTGTRSVIRGAGTPGFAAPEQYDGGTDARTDIYALGATLYALLTDRIPPTPGEIMSGATTPPPLESLAPGVSKDLARTVRQMLEIARDRRPQDMDEVRRLLGAAAPHAPPAAAGSGALVLAGFGLLIVMLAGIWGVSRQARMAAGTGTPSPSMSVPPAVFVSPAASVQPSVSAATVPAPASAATARPPVSAATARPPVSAATARPPVSAATARPPVSAATVPPPVSAATVPPPASAATAPPPASATAAGDAFVPGRTFGWLRVGMPLTEVTARLGPVPETSREATGEGQLYRSHGLALVTRDGVVVGIAKLNMSPDPRGPGPGEPWLGTDRAQVLARLGNGYQEARFPGGGLWLAWPQGIAYQFRDPERVTGIMVFDPAILGAR